jgi:hypothetical protein
MDNAIPLVQLRFVTQQRRPSHAASVHFFR